MKRFVTTWALLLLSSVALALPAPKDIEAAVRAGHLSQAETMLHEVIKEKPGSAKAHYELGQVLAREGHSADARGELLEAQRLDPSLKFASDPQRFRDLLNRLPAASASTAPALRSPAPVPVGVAAASAGASAFPWGYVLLGVAFVVLIWFVVRRATAPTATRLGASGMATAGTVAPGGYGYGGAPYGVPPQAPGSGVGGAVLGGLAGMAAGYGLAKVLEGNDEHRQAQAADNSGFIPIDGGSTPDYGAFDAGSGSDDSWDAGDSSGGDDSW